MDARFMQMHNFVLIREIIINSIFPVDRMRELNFHRETAVQQSIKGGTTENWDQYQYLGNCPPTLPLTQQHSIDNELRLMLG